MNTEDQLIADIIETFKSIQKTDFINDDIRRIKQEDICKAFEDYSLPTLKKALAVLTSMEEYEWCSAIKSVISDKMVANSANGHTR